MRERNVKITSLYLLACSFVALTFSLPVPYALENAPVGQMVSRGDVRYETASGWKPVDVSYFPVFLGTKIKTEKGVAALGLCGSVQIEVAEQTLFSLPERDVFALNQGGVRFRIPEGSGLTLKAGEVSVVKSQREKSVVGSVSIRANGTVAVESLEGELTILHGDRSELTRLSSKEAVTVSVPSEKGKAVALPTVAKLNQGGTAGESREVFQGPSMGFLIATQSASEKEDGRISKTGESTGLFPKAKDILLKIICAP